MIPQVPIANDRLPRLPYGKMWAAASAVAAGILLFFEALARVAGFQGMPNDDIGLWCLARSRVRDSDPDQYVLIGTSRMQVDLDTATFARAAGTKDPVQLAIVGAQPGPVLRHLAGQELFQGIVVCDFFPSAVFNLNPGETLSIPTDYVKAYDNRSATLLIERRLKLSAELSLASMNCRFFPFHALRKWIYQGKLPHPNMFLEPDRWWKVDYASLDPAQKAFSMEDDHRPVPMPLEQLAGVVQDIETSVGRIQERGGRVVFVRFPVSDGFLEMESRLFPRDPYWNALAGHTQAVTIHFEDYPALAGFVPADGSHLDCLDAPPFSQALGEIVRGKVSRHPYKAP